MQSKLFKIVPVAAIVVILSFVFYPAFNLPSIEAQHGYDGQNSKVFDTDQYEELIATSTNVIQITSGKISITEPRTQRAYIQFTGQGARWLCEGTTPSTTFGNEAKVDTWITLNGLADIQAFRFVLDDGSGTSTAHVNLQILGVQLP